MASLEPAEVDPSTNEFATLHIRNDDDETFTPGTRLSVHFSVHVKTGLPKEAFYHAYQLSYRAIAAGPEDNAKIIPDPIEKENLVEWLPTNSGTGDILHNYCHKLRPLDEEGDYTLRIDLRSTAQISRYAKDHPNAKPPLPEWKRTTVVFDTWEFKIEAFVEHPDSSTGIW
ncbi:hypothetical protein Micbo1qcDRAFT_178066 [Microdochium bolleyi]|uniref:Uncharacterized protein n=1 Tax=Microdochium bolleyi TaxID=196109 RepID=A0A136IU79_9PEZI|nr:hypothetical protein Micbo1qcDRAFT_178066 [Microdochium bolleyi]